jgi:hypothetical protein
MFIDFNEDYGSVRKEILYNIFIEFGVTMKLVRPIKMCLNETYNKVCIDKHLSNNFPTHKYLKQGDALSPLLLNFASEYAIRKIQETQEGLKVSEAHQFLDYADDVNLLGDSINEGTENLFYVSKEVGRETNVEKTKYVYVAVSSPECKSNSEHKNSEQIVWKCVKVQIFRDESNKSNLIQEEIKRRLNSGNACHRSAQNFCLLVCCQKKRKIRIYKTIILPGVLYLCGTWSLTLREEHRLRVLMKGVVRRIFGPRRDEVTRGW